METPSSRNPLMTEPTPKRRAPDSADLPAAAPSAPLRPAPGGETLIGSDTVVEGRILSQGEVRIDGTFKGEIVSNSRVVVGPTGKLEGSVEAKAMVLNGRVEGNLKVLERLELLATAEVHGDLETQPGALIIEKGARLEGRCTMGLTSPPAVPRPAPALSTAPTATPQKPPVSTPRQL